MGHSPSARKHLAKYPIGTVAEADAEELTKNAPAASASGGGALPLLVLGAILVAAVAWFLSNQVTKNNLE